jgi:hypothetical protein
MSLNSAAKVIEHYIRHKPFEISDETKYINFINFIAEVTVSEFSENEPIIEEKVFTTESSLVGDSYILVDIYDQIDEKLLSLILLEEYSSLSTSINHVFSGYIGTPVESRAIDEAIKNGSVISFLAVRDAFHIIEEWFYLNTQKIIYGGDKVKLVPDTKYYVMYRRYRTLEEIKPKEFRTFKELFEINLMLGIYQSDTFITEAGIRNVSLSGLSIGFNFPKSETKVEKLQRRKDEILANAAMVYDEDIIGLI